ncbi:phosphatidylinositol n-acetylglucosaminyltransferase subunit c [Lichtheimia corymbifera JMRC:FSU:9682]|uniref:Phosphatidylinositol n-acetylglucosaminyltransferase subunit c n=1 Tax=Lichtheimia corymbifera JMRC:FSU:9682 TaxID=1263082 RepID=A0A068RYQ7_9FUNG|nr:phosphatidylinositol n-acetylglucosaminyltransferase subunit c [Lichtheimia corymbifera JMRC:FSU:9682]
MDARVAHQFPSPGYQYNPTNPPWRKLLWVKQNYPDNYVDSTFLDELQKNVNVRTYDYWKMVYESGVITQHISSVVIFIAVFIYLQMGALVANHLIWTGSFMTGVGYVIWDLVMIQQTAPHRGFERKRVAKSAVFFFATLLGLSPILKTLTSQTSDDTIWALTVCCFLANVLFHDYGSQSRARVKFIINECSHICFVEWFALFPIFRRYLQDMNPKVQIMLTILMLLTSVAMFIRISKAVVFLYILSFCFITFICPWWLIFIQKYKNEIHGPWDEARPRLQRSRKNVYRKRSS